MKAVFLDIDGVLNCETRWRAGHCVRVNKSPGSMIDPDAVARLTRIVQATRAKVVVSSSWRVLHPHERIQEYLSRFGLPERTVIGATGRLRWPLTMLSTNEWLSNRLDVVVPRGHEIRAWLNAHPGVRRYVVLDDDSDMDLVEDGFVKTTWKYGLQDEHVERCIEKLNATNSFHP